MTTARFSDIRRNILQALDSAEMCIQVAVYWFTNRELFDKLCQICKNGITVELIVHNDFINSRASGIPFQRLIDAGGHFFMSPSEKPMHNKFCIIDDQLLITGSYNWTYFAEEKNDENVVFINNDNSIIESYKAQFEKIKESLKCINNYKPISIYDLDGSFNQEYLANDLLIQAVQSEKPEIIHDALNLIPHNIQIQQSAIKFNLIKSRSLLHSIGIEVEQDKFLIIFSKESLLPIKKVQVLNNLYDDQEICGTTIRWGENPSAKLNTLLQKPKIAETQARLSVKIPKMKRGEAQLKFIATIDLYGTLNAEFLSLDNGNRKTYSIDLLSLGILSELK